MTNSELIARGEAYLHTQCSLPEHERTMACDIIRDLIAALPKWNYDMEAAPKDGTKILVLTVHDEIEVTEYYRLEREVYHDEGNGFYSKRKEIWTEGWNGNAPKAWMPLPEGETP